MSDAIFGLLDEMERQLRWLELAHHRDFDASNLALGKSLSEPWKKIEIEEGNFPRRSQIQSKSRIWTRYDYERAKCIGVKTTAAVGESGSIALRDNHSFCKTRVWIFVHGFRRFERNGKLTGPAGFLQGLQQPKSFALVEAHKCYPTIAELIVAACRVHNLALERWADYDMPAVRRLVKRDRRAIDRVRNSLPDPRYLKKRRGGRPAPPQCPKCGVGRLYARSKPKIKGSEKLATRYRYCDNDKCDHHVTETVRG